MERNKIEFSIGDKVTYNPYGIAHEMVVVEVDGYTPMFGQDERIFYRLGMALDKSLKDFTPPITSITTGLCIQQSIYFEESDE